MKLSETEKWILGGIGFPILIALLISCGSWVQSVNASMVETEKFIGMGGRYTDEQARDNTDYIIQKIESGDAIQTNEIKNLKEMIDKQGKQIDKLVDRLIEDRK